ncbi:hypothetical protein HZY83_02410 [Gemella sp. GH3]|uniref:hypothetical protein n=1 Tax=unclassified Gemella TaxID=2624949 RepID=UPI0015D0A385|nr:MULTISPECIES: hypothetical protein [unclassified Gemella]MBF0713539.1 hypothetical protein [Gemella sp. GH3.1]NYS50491.1 hypothetical protein [Gemella sp. GH3]
MNFIAIKDVLEYFNYNIGIKININGIDTAIEKREWHLGGYRHYFICPSCNKSCIKLFAYKGKLYLCTVCSGNRARQLNRTKTDMSYYYRLGMKEARKVDSNFKLKTAYWVPEFPKIPPRMSVEKYMKHWRKYHHYFDLYIACFYKHARCSYGRRKVREPPQIVRYLEQLCEIKDRSVKYNENLSNKLWGNNL